MRKKIPFLLAAITLVALYVRAQDVIIKIIGGEQPAIAVPDFRGAGETQPYMGAFNQTLFGDLQDSGLFKMAPKSLYPTFIPQQPSDFQPPQGTVRRGPWLTDWSSPPTSAKYLAFGYAAPQGGQIVLSGWLYDVGQADLTNAQLFGKRYFGTIDEAGARKVAHEFAAEIIARFGGESLAGTKIYFVSDRTGHKEVWSMDPDGSNQKQITQYRSTTITPGVSPDGTKLAFTTFAKVNPAIFVISLETGRQLLFYNPIASMNATPSFTPDGKHVLFASTASGYANIYMADLDGGHLQRLSTTRAIEVEPKVNPKTGREIVFVSGRSGPQQIYIMTIDGTEPQRLTDGTGEASNPAWHPNGQVIAFAWSRGYEPGHFNVFLMDVASRRYDQLTHGEGRNENPTWAPDGRHLVFASNRSGTMQIWTMLADGTNPQRLTTQGRNTMPVWGKQPF